MSENGCGRGGWLYEGTIGLLASGSQSGFLPLYRYWNGAIGDHFYTTNPGEVLSGGGYVSEGIIGYIATSQRAGTIPLYRWYSASVQDHLYTTDPQELTNGQSSYVREGITGYVFEARASDQFNCPKPDLTITSVSPVQVVYDTDLVVGKATAVRLKLHATGCEKLGAIEFQVQVGSAAPQVERRDSAAFDSSCDAEVVSDVRYTPASSGALLIKATADPRKWIPESNESNNDGQITPNVRLTHPLTILYLPVTDCDGNIPDATYLPTIAAERDYLSTLYPIADGAYNAVVSSSLWTGTVCDLLPFRWQRSLLRLSRYGKRLLPQAKKVVGVTDPAGFWMLSQLGALPTGLTYPYSTSAVVVPGFPGTISHEVGHMYGRWWFSEEYLRYPPAGRTTSGFLVSSGTPIEDAICFMGNHTAPFASHSVWIDRDDYVGLLEEFAKNPSDPDALAIAGLVHRDGRFELDGLEFLHDASVDADATVPLDLPNDLVKRVTITVRDESGRAVSEVTTAVLFSYNLESGVQAVETDVAPMFVTIALPSGAQQHSVSIIIDGARVFQTRLSSGLLRDTIQRLPDAAFAIRADSDRRLLLRQVDLVEDALERAEPSPAIKALWAVLRRSLLLRVLPEYHKTDPLQLTRTEILSLLDQLATSTR